MIEERGRLLEALSAMPVTTTASEANFLWIAAHELPGADLAAALDGSRVHVADGEPLGDAGHVRAAIRDRHAADRLLWALGEALPGARTARG